MLDPTPTGPRPGGTPLLQTIGLTKRYGDFLANDQIDIEIRPQQIHALLGENGAGKSTLVKIIYGLIQPSEGEMRWLGEKMVLSGPSEARARGIGMVFQHFSLFDNLTVAENVALGLDGKESFKDMSARLEQVSRTYGLPLDPRREVWQLSVGERQRIEIVRALMQNPKFLILDEPTAVLTPQEADQLFVVLERLKAEGRAILYISHKLEEVKRLCDTATILRGGKKVATCNPQAETAASLARMMVGADIKEVKAPAGRKTTVPRLVVNDLSMEPDDPHGVRLQQISLELKGGEILGIAGVAGNGQRELSQVLTGLRATTGGTIEIDGGAVEAQDSAIFVERGIGHIPEDRLRSGLAPSLSVTDNAVLREYNEPPVSRGPVFDTRAADHLAHQIAEAADVAVPDFGMPVRNLSGGNQQRLVARREMRIASKVLVAAYPSRGLDVGAINTMLRYFVEMRDRGVAVILISEELEELLNLSDRIAVLYEGRVMGDFPAENANLETIGLLMGGRSQQAAPIQ